MNQTELDDIKSHDVSECFLGAAVIRAQSKKKMLYTGEHELGNGQYIIEIYLNEKEELIIDATHKERPDERFIIDNDKDKSKSIQDEFKNDFYDMAEHLRVMNLRMILMNKVSFPI